jgi:hypothetical protein
MIENKSLIQCFCKKIHMSPSPILLPSNCHPFKESKQAEVLLLTPEASGSTVVWQILDILLDGRVRKSHNIADSCPACFLYKYLIGTSRNPYDMYFSTSRKRQLSVDEFVKELESEYIFCTFKTFHSNAPGYQKDLKILNLKYEVYWNEDEKRLDAILDFLNIKIPEGEKIKIINATSLKKNIERSKIKTTPDKNNNISYSHISKYKGKPGSGSNLPDSIKEEIYSKMTWYFEYFGYQK